ncbi:MAG: preprotein translocase subunit SecG [Legionellaceae bacterium]|nr:preprotein translocase subunit SecG [Legionellaceae bacterium]
MYQIVLMVHMFVALMLVGLVLIQYGKGADIGASFGSGASNTVFGSQGAGGFLFRMTAGLGLAFFITSLTLSYIVSTEYQHAQLQVVPKSGTVPSSDVPVHRSVTLPSNDIPVPVSKGAKSAQEELPEPK